MTPRHQQGADLRVRALTRRFGQVLALDAVNLHVPAGSVHGLIGPNGAGKTTLIGALLGLVRPDSGQLTFGDLPLRTVSCRVPGGLAGTIEQPRFYGYLSARRNLDVLARLDGPGGLEPRQALSRVGLGAQADVKAAKLSLGMRQRLAIAAAVMRRPALLILDEPTGGLDPVGAEDLLQLIRGLATDGSSVVLSSHDLTLVADACDAVTVLVRGRVVRTDRVTQLIADAPSPTFRLRTGDDRQARQILSSIPGIDVEPEDPAGGLLVTAAESDLDVAVGEIVSRGIPLRELGSHRSPLHLLYDRLTSDADRHRPPPTVAA